MSGGVAAVTFKDSVRTVDTRRYVRSLGLYTAGAPAVYRHLIRISFQMALMGWFEEQTHLGAEPSQEF